MEDIERRSHETELRFTDGAGAKASVLSGYAAVFGVLSSEMGPQGKRFRERIMPGAFRSALASGENVLAFYHHGLAGGMPGSTMPLGSTQDGSLRIHEDAHGLGFELELPDTTQGRDLAVLAKKGTVKGASFAFRGQRDTWHREQDGLLVRTMHEIVGLRDVSPTHSPAYADTTIAIRSLEAWEGAVTRALNDRGEISFEQRQEALSGALRRLLGDPWSREQTEPWFVVATFDASVVVQRSGKFFAYPVTWRGIEAVLGEPGPVEQVYKPGAGPVDAGAASKTRHLRLAEIDLGAHVASKKA